jgi:Holliday junction resolvasome RuvABC endonuclease subunit
LKLPNKSSILFKEVYVKYIWALDLSLSCVGISIFDNDAKSVLITSVDTKSEKEHQRKLKIIADYLLLLKEKYEPEKLIIEGGFSRFNASTQAIYKVFGLCQYLFNEIPQIYYQPSTIKKVVGGKGNMTKDDLKMILEKKYNVSFLNTDESDSYAIGLCYFINMGSI